MEFLRVSCLENPLATERLNGVIKLDITQLVCGEDLVILVSGIAACGIACFRRDPFQ